jgi:hypothetical protein
MHLALRVKSFSDLTILPSLMGTRMACLARSISAAPILAMPRWRRRLACVIVGAASLFATEAMAIDVANQTDWNTAVAAVAAAGAGSTVSINFTSGFTLTSSLAQLQANNTNVTVNITGNGQTINGASAFQGIQVNGANAPTVNISSLAITNAAALGGTGAAGQNGFFSSGLSLRLGRRRRRPWCGRRIVRRQRRQRDARRGDVHH